RHFPITGKTSPTAEAQTDVRIQNRRPHTALVHVLQSRRRLVASGPYVLPADAGGLVVLVLATRHHIEAKRTRRGGTRHHPSVATFFQVDELRSLFAQRLGQALLPQVRSLGQMVVG